MVLVNQPRRTQFHVTLRVYKAKGELVASVIDRGMTEGRREAVRDAKNDRGYKVSSGICFYRIVAGDFVQTRKIVRG